MTLLQPLAVVRPTQDAASPTFADTLWNSSEIVDAEVIEDFPSPVAARAAEPRSVFSVDDDEIELIERPSAEMAWMIEQTRPSIEVGRLRRFETLYDDRMLDSEAQASVVAERVLSDPALQEEILRSARGIVTRLIVEGAHGLAGLIGPEHAEELEARVRSSLARVERAQARFVDQLAEGSPIPVGASGYCVREIGSGTSVWVGVRRESLQSVLEIAVHELLHAAEAEVVLTTDKGDVSPVWIKTFLADELLPGERFSVLEISPKTAQDFQNLNYVFGTGDILSEGTSPARFFKNRIQNWHEVLIDSLALAGLNLFMMDTPLGTSPGLTFGADQMVPPYETLPVSDEEFADSVAIRGYPIAHVLHAEALEVIAGLGSDAKESLQRVETLVYGAMFFATSDGRNFYDEPSALETHFLKLLNQAVEDLGTIRFLFFLSLIAGSYNEFPIRTTVSLH